MTEEKDEDMKISEEELVDKMLELIEENLRLKAILRSEGILHMHRESLTPVV